MTHKLELDAEMNNIEHIRIQLFARIPTNQLIWTVLSTYEYSYLHMDQPISWFEQC